MDEVKGQSQIKDLMTAKTSLQPWTKVLLTIGQDHIAMTRVELSADGDRSLIVRRADLVMAEDSHAGFDLLLRIPHEGYEILGVDRWNPSESRRIAKDEHIIVNKTTHQVTFENESEDKLEVVIRERS